MQGCQVFRKSTVISHSEYITQWLVISLLGHLYHFVWGGGRSPEPTELK